MMGKPQNMEPKLFYHSISLERRVPDDHALRKIKKCIDFDFVRKSVADSYGKCGNPSVDPAVILKLMFLLFYENVKSERQLMQQLPLRMDWLWFCGYDLDEQTPDHSVISKARHRWGLNVFAQFFQNILEQCIEAGLVDGETIYIDSSLIDANASKDKLRCQLRLIGGELYDKLEEAEQPEKLEKRVSPVDPDARLCKKYSKTTLGYKDHRVVDDKYGIVTATLTTAANVNDEKMLSQTIGEHQLNTGSTTKTVVADKAYGIGENYKYLHENNITPCINHQRYISNLTDKFTNEMFSYNEKIDCYICPAGKKLKRWKFRGCKNSQVYRADRETCEQCEHLNKCVSSKRFGRQIHRNINKKYFEWADNCLSGYERRRLQGKRKYKIEGSFADATNNHGFKRARWRGLAKMTIQNLMIATIQNLRKLLNTTSLRKAAALAISTANKVQTQSIEHLSAIIRLFLTNMPRSTVLQL